MARLDDTKPRQAIVAEDTHRGDEAAAPRRYKLPDLRAGDSDAPNPLAAYSWPQLRELIYYSPNQSWHG